MKNFEKTYRIISDIETLKDWVKDQTTFDFAFDTETTALEYDKLKLVGCSFYNGSGGAVFIQFNFSTEVTRVIPDRNNKSRKITKVDLFEKKDAIPVQEGLEVLKPLFEHPLTMANSKFDCKVMHKYGIELKIKHDTFLLSYCLNSSTPNGLKENAKEHLKFEMVSYEETVGMKPGAIDWNKVDWKAYGRYGALDAYATYRLSKVLIDKLQALGTGEVSPWNCYINVELPLVPVVVEMETSGVRIDVELLKDMKRRIEIREKELERKVYEMAEVQFNLDSPKQLAEILFDRFEMPIINKTKSGSRSVGEDTLKELAYLGYELPEAILEYRKINKLKSTYTDGLIEMVDSDGRLRSNFNQAGTSTGRFASSQINFQNIANNKEFPIKKAFVPADGYVFIGGDFSQLELRVMAHMGDDPSLIKTYTENPRADIHQKTADEVTLVTHTNITRSQGKTLNFSILFGMMGKTLSYKLNKEVKGDFKKGLISKEVCDKSMVTQSIGDKMVDGFYKAYKGFKRGGDLVAYNGSKTGYAETITGRRRYIPELQKKNTYEQGKRYAVSTWIQGSAADLVKLAMLNLFQRLIEEDLKKYCRFLIQVHDEVVLEVKEEYAEMIVPIMQHEFENVWKGFKVPLICDINQLVNWYDLKVSPAKKEVKQAGGVDVKTLKILKVI